MEKSSAILKQIWGYDQFRPMQEEIVDAAINGKDVLAILPTGGGKSICFQVPGLAREGICIVISPLIALMQDQVNQLQQRGVRARALTSGMSYREMDIVLDNARFGGLDFLYVSPERLKTQLFVERLKLMEVGLFVVDEAHCISEWGHDFRPPYREISEIKKWHPHVPMMALTATATERVKEDIIECLLLHQYEQFEASFERPNVSYEIYAIDNKSKGVLDLCKRMEGAVGIVYCQTRRSVKEVTQLLISQGIKANMYHGGMDSEARAQSLTHWMQEKTPVMVATNAFGMGIDKPNVRFVTHFEIPNNPEAYFQEAGRAGRDGAPSRTFAFIEPGDLNALEERILQQYPEIDEIKFIYRALCNHLKIAIGSGDGETYPLALQEFVKRFDLQLTSVYPAFKLLEMNGDILFSDLAFHGSRVKFTINNAHLYSFQLSNPRVDQLIGALSRTYNNLFDEFSEINEKYLREHLKITQAELTAQLKYLEERGIIDITWRTSNPLITFLHQRFPDDYLELKPEKYFFRKERALERFKAIQQLIESEDCRPQTLMNYFGQTSQPCGICDVCKKKQKSTRDIEAEILQHLSTPTQHNELLERFDQTEHEQVKSALRHLLLEERISATNGAYALLK